TAVSSTATIRSQAARTRMPPSAALTNQRRAPKVLVRLTDGLLSEISKLLLRRSLPRRRASGNALVWDCRVQKGRSGVSPSTSFLGSPPPTLAWPRSDPRSHVELGTDASRGPRRDGASIWPTPSSEPARGSALVVRRRLKQSVFARSSLPFRPNDDRYRRGPRRRAGCRNAGSFCLSPSLRSHSATSITDTRQ